MTLRFLLITASRSSKLTTRELAESVGSFNLYCTTEGRYTYCRGILQNLPLHLLRRSPIGV